MKVILLKDVKKVGRKDEVVEASNGYAQNVLLPQKLAMPATPENLKRLQKQEGLVADKKAFDESLLAKNIKELTGKTIIITVRANDNGTLFQSLHTKHIQEAIKKQFGFSFLESSFIGNDIKKIGDYEWVVTSDTTQSKFTVNVKAN